MLKRVLGLLVVANLVASCAAKPPPVSESPWVEAWRNASRESTPFSWREHDRWTFEVRGPEGEDLGLISLELTDEPIMSCSTNAAYKARLIESTTTIAPLETWYDGEYAITYPAYEIRGRTLFLTLNATVCDANYNLAGFLSDDGGEGVVQGEGLAWYEDIGTFEARRYEEPSE